MSHYQPAEWSPHRCCWLAWPSDGDLWLNLQEVQDEFVALCYAIREPLEILVMDEAALDVAQRRLKDLQVNFHLIPFGDIWLRDTAPIFMKNSDGTVAAARFRFNGWGGKYILSHDDQVSEQIARASHLKEISYPFILEGGSVDVDGEGTCLTSRQCLLNENRNPQMSQLQIEEQLCTALGVQKVLWLNDGLLNDHTDGHIDTIARFVAPGVVVCMQARDSNDQNHDVLEQIASDLENFTDAKGRQLKVVRIPSPGNILDDEGQMMPASYLNFYIGNQTVVVPTYGSVYDSEAVDAIASLFPGRQTVGLSARAILAGGGAFHCITQQQPK